jgi:hypothetical protein
MKTTIDMAREAGFTWEPINNIIGPLKRFEQLVRADEREVVVKLLIELKVVSAEGTLIDAIRARGQA